MDIENRNSILGLYEYMLNSVIRKMDNLYNEKKIDSETYSAVIAQNSCEFMKIAAATVQSFLQLESDIKYKDSQVSQVNAQTRNIVVEGNNLYKQGELISSQIAYQNKQIEGLNAEIQKSEAELRVINADVIAAMQKVDLVISQIELQKAQVLSEKVARLKNEKSIKQMDLQSTAIALSLPKVATDNLISKEQLNLAINQVTKSVKEIIATQSAIDKSNQEINVLKAKEKTEKANTEKNFSNDSLIGKQANLYENQATSYVNSNKLAVTKVFTDTWNTSKMVDSGLSTVDTKLNNKNIGKVVSELTKTAFTGITLE